MEAKSLEVSGKSVDEAVAKGLATLGLSAAQVRVEVLKQGSRGLFGLGGEEARVRLTPRPPAPPPAAPSADLAQTGREVLQHLLDGMGIRARVETRPGVAAAAESEAPLVLDVRGPDLGVLIGRRAETLAALQFMTRLIVSHRLSHTVNLVVDVEQYRLRREKQLQNLAQRMAERVQLSGRPVALEAMPAFERRIVHLALRDHPAVQTQSVGEGEHRKVMIIPRK